MKRMMHSDEQIIGKLREAEALLSAGKSIPEVCRHLGIGESTYYRWRSEYHGAQASHARRLKELEQENARLKKLVAEQALDISMLREVARGNY
jgi:putative transposase